MDKYQRIHATSGAVWEDIVGYSRAVRIGNIIEVSGTTAVEDGQVIALGNAYEQTVFILRTIQKALDELGSGMEDVVRTRMYVTDIHNWEAIGKAHGAYFSEIKPASTMVEVSGLINRDMLVEIEVTAIIQKH